MSAGGLGVVVRWSVYSCAISCVVGDTGGSRWAHMHVV